MTSPPHTPWNRKHYFSTTHVRDRGVVIFWKLEIRNRSLIWPAHFFRFRPSLPVMIGNGRRKNLITLSSSTRSVYRVKVFLAIIFLAVTFNFGLPDNSGHSWPSKPRLFCRSTLKSYILKKILRKICSFFRLFVHKRGNSQNLKLSYWT